LLICDGEHPHVFFVNVGMPSQVRVFGSQALEVANLRHLLRCAAGVVLRRWRFGCKIYCRGTGWS